MKPVPVRVVSLLKACRNHVNASSQLPRMGSLAAPLPPPPLSPSPPLPYQLLKPPSSSFSSHGNPCLDLLFNVVQPHSNTPRAKAEATHKYLKQLLPLAWSHNPLTTLKLICNLLDRFSDTGKKDEQGFYAAAYWLHQNHPRTLASNLIPIAGSFGGMGDLVQVLYRILSRQDVMNYDDDWQIEERMFSVDDKVALERYRSDMDYRFLHDQVSDLFAHCIKRDIRILKEGMDRHDGDRLEITHAADYCEDTATFLCESVARDVFPRELHQEYQNLKEADYSKRVRERLRKEVLVPLRKASDNVIVTRVPYESNKWGYDIIDMEFDREPSFAKKYFEEVKSDQSKIAADALLPHQIIEYVDDVEVGRVAELQWKAMVKDMKNAQGKKKKMKILNNSLAVCDVSRGMYRYHRDVSVGLGLLLSELNKEPAWKGKVINFSKNVKLHSTKRLDDLKSMCAFVRRMDCQDWRVHFGRLFQLILKVAVKKNLKPEQMIKRVFVFIGGYAVNFDEDGRQRWASDYEVIRSMYKEAGYGNVVPHLVVWNMRRDIYTPPFCATHHEHGVTMLNDLSDNLIKSFLDNDGEIGPEHVMEAAISAQPYQTLAVVD